MRFACLKKRNNKLGTINSSKISNIHILSNYLWVPKSSFTAAPQKNFTCSNIYIYTHIHIYINYMYLICIHKYIILQLCVYI
jgi:hypothetical protein